MEIDIGTRAIREDFQDEDKETLVHSIIRNFTYKMNEVFKNIEIKGFPVVSNPDGELVGKWVNGNMHTMTHQSVLLGVPAMQLEIPRSVRALLIRDRNLLSSFAQCILSTYYEIIVP